MNYLENYREGQKFTGVYLCKEKRILKTKAGKTYYSVLLQDKSGTADGKVWDLNNGIEDFDNMDYIHCDGLVTSFQGSLQMNLNRIRRAGEGEYDTADYVPCSQKDVGEMYSEILKYVAAVKEEHLHKLLEHFFVEDKEFIDEFKKHSAAKSVHHAFMGGLLQHTLAVTDLCAFYCKQYPILNRDLLITAALLHDMGKIDEISGFPNNDYVDEGQLMGHIMIGSHKVASVIESIPGFPQKLSNEVIHCILAHHGQYEYGSPKIPAIIEAEALHHADNTDAKLQTMTEVFEKSTEEGWLGYNRLFESNLRKTSK